MALLVADRIRHAYGVREILRNVSPRVTSGDRIGIVGPNGEGKTTLLRILAGFLEPTEGSVSRPADVGVGYLPQEPPAPSDATVRETMLAVFDDLRAVEAQLHDLAGRIDTDPAAMRRYGELQVRFETDGGYDYPRRIEQVLDGLRFDRDLRDRPLSKLSGGQRTRAHLAALLLKSPEVLMLDEPTNHLDLDAVEWLEGWLADFPGALLVVSHDRYFLDRATGQTWEVAAGTVETYRGSYSDYLPKRAERVEERRRQWEAQEQYIAETREFIARNLAGQRTKEAQGRRTRLERFLREEAIERPPEQRTISLRLSPGRRSGENVLTAEGLVAGYVEDKPLVSAAELRLRRGERVAVVGANGIGKTALLRTLLGEMPPLAGEVHWGTNVRTGYLSQTQSELPPEQTPVESVLAAAPDCPLERARTLLGTLLLSGDDAYKRIDQLSGGQRSRVVLARLIAARANVLALDEPTNHLDVPTTEILQDALKHFDGTVLMVTHDRYLVQAVATHIWVVADGGIQLLHGGWDAYLAWRAGRREADRQPKREDARAKKDRKAAFAESRRQANLQQRLRRRHEHLEADIAAAETDLAGMHDAISRAGEDGNVQRIEELGRQYQRKNADLEAMLAEWERIGERLEEE